MSSIKTQKSSEVKENISSPQGTKDKPSAQKESNDVKEPKDNTKPQANETLKKGLKAENNTIVNENNENPEQNNAKKKTSKKKKEETNTIEQKVQESNEQEKKDNPKEEEKQVDTGKTKKKVGDKTQEKVKDGDKKTEEEKTEAVKIGDKSKPKKGTEKVEISENDPSVPAKALPVSNGKPKETIVIKNEPQKPTNLKETIHLNKNEKSKEPNVVQGSIQLNPKNSQPEAKQAHQKPITETKNTKNIQESQAKGKSTQSETLASPKQELTKPNASNQKPGSSEIKLNEVVDKAKVIADSKLKSKPSSKKEELANPSKVEEPKNKNLAVQEKQKVDDKKGLTPKNHVQNDQAKKGEPSDGSRTVTNKNAKPSEFAKNSTRPISRADNVENTENANSTRRGQKNEIEKMRVRSFDAGKTDKISADDSFETRTKLWDIRKKERLLEEEKKRLRKETEECTFSPQLNPKSLNRASSPGSIYERNLEWSSKVKATLASKGEQMFEEARKSEVKKHRVNSAVEPVRIESKPVKHLSTDNFVPKCGIIKPNTLLPQNQGPLDIKGNVTEQVSEINEMFDVITSAIKQKPLKAAYKLPETQIPKVQKPIEEDHKKETTYSYQSKPLSQKTIKTKNEPEVNRIDSLKGILNFKQGEKKEKKQVSKSPPQDSGKPEVLLSDTNNAAVLLKENSKRLEIRNNRYVMVDNNHNISAIEKKDIESNNQSLNFEVNEVHETNEVNEKKETDGVHGEQDVQKAIEDKETQETTEEKKENEINEAHEENEANEEKEVQESHEEKEVNEVQEEKEVQEPSQEKEENEVNEAHGEKEINEEKEANGENEAIESEEIL